MADMTGTFPSTGELQGVISNAGLIGGTIAGTRGPKGDKGDTGNGIATAVLNADYTLTLTFTDGTSTTTSSIRGAQGIQGETGVSITGVTLNSNYTLTITFSDGTSTTTDSIRGAKGETGDTGNGIASIAKTATSGLVDTYTVTYTNGGTWTYNVTNGQNGTGSVADVWQNGVSVLDGDTAKVTVPTKTSDLTNDAGYITGYIETDPTVPSWAKQANKPSYAYSEITGTPTLATVATTGDYDDLTNKPTIPTVPTNVSDFTNDANYQNATQVASAVNEAKVLQVDVSAFSSLPQTVSNNAITADHVVVNSVLGTPSAQTGDWTVTTSAGSLTIAGTIGGSTTLTLYLAVKQ